MSIGRCCLEYLDCQAADPVGEARSAGLVTVRLGFDVGHRPSALGLPGRDPRPDERADDPRSRRDQGDEDRRLVRHGAEYEATGLRRIWGAVPNVRTFDRSGRKDREGSTCAGKGTRE